MVSTHWGPLLLSALAATPLAGLTLDEAVAQHQAGRLEAAAAAYRTIAESDLPATVRSAALNNLCVLLHDQGRASDALGVCEQAVDLRRTSGTTAEVVDSIGNWALALQAAGQRSLALSQIEEAARMAREASLDEPLAFVLSNAAAFEIENGRYGAALDHLAEAERLAERPQAAAWAPQQLPALRVNRAVALERLGAWPEALELLRELDLDPNLDPRSRATAEVDRAVVVRNLGDPRAAARALDSAAASFRRIGDDAGLVNALVNLGLAHELDLRDPDRARAAYAEAARIAATRDDGEGATQAALGLARVALATGDLPAASVESEAALARAESLGDPEARWAALAVAAGIDRAAGELDRAQERLARALAIVESVRSAGGSPRARAGYLADKRALFASALELAARRALSSGRVEDRLEALAIVERAKARELLDALGADREPLDRDGLAALVASGSRALLFAFGERTLWRFELAEGELSLTELGEAETIARAARSARHELDRGHGLDRLDTLGPQILAGLPAPRAAFALILDRELSPLPIEALPFPDGKRLYERAAPFRLPSLSFAAQASRGATSPEWIYLGVAPTVAAADPRSEAGILAARFRLAPLPASAAEVASFAARIGRRSATLIGDRGTEDAVRAQLAGGAAILHFAAHALLDDRLTRNGAAILLASPGGSAFDARLTPEEIADLPLDGTLVVLSGCSTARGSHADGRSLTTLTGAFLAAGASGVVASLGDVGDRRAAALVEQLGHELARGARPAEALRDAQRRIAVASGIDAESLASWFVLFGDPEPPLSRRPPIAAWLLVGSGAIGLVGTFVRYRSSGSTNSSAGSARATTVPAASSASRETR